MVILQRWPHIKKTLIECCSLVLLGCIGVAQAAIGPWTRTGPADTQVSCVVFDPTNSKIMYVGTPGKGVLKTTDRGVNWLPANKGIEAASVQHLVIAPTNSQILYAGTSSHQGRHIFKTIDGGQNWVSAENGHASYVDAITTLAIDPTNPDRVYAGYMGFNYGLLRTTDGGKSWNVSYGGRGITNMPQHVVVDPKNPQILYMAKVDGPLKSTDGGQSWSNAYRGIPQALIDRIAVNPVNTDIVYATLKSVYKSLDGGQNWTKASTGLPDSVIAITVDPRNPDTVYVGLIDGGVYRTENGGQSWQAFNTGIADLTIGTIVLDPQDTHNIYALSSLYRLHFTSSTSLALTDFYFPLVADGGGYFSNFILGNPEDTPADVSLELFKPEGTTLSLNLNGTVNAAFSLSLPAHGVLNLRSPNIGDMQTGWARIRSIGKITAALICGYAPGGVTSEEAGMDPVVPGSTFRIPVDNRNGVTTGLAIANPYAQAVTLRLILYNSTGAQVGQQEISLPAMNQTARPINAFIPEATANFTGRLLVTSLGDAVAAAILRYTPSLSAFSSTPVVPGSSMSSYLYFPQIADGGGYKSTIMLMNLSYLQDTADLEIYKQDGTAWPLSLNGTVGSSHRVSLPANGLLVLESSNSNSSAVSGWARLIRNTQPIGAGIAYSYQGNAVSEAATGRSPLTSRFHLPVDTRGGFYTGIAITNPNSEAVTLELQLYDRQGTLLGKKNRTLGGLKQMAEIEFMLFPEVPMADFTGSILVSATGGQVAATVLRFNLSSSIIASLPVSLLP